MWIVSKSGGGDKSYVDKGDASTLAASKTYADSGDAKTLQSAKEYVAGLTIPGGDPNAYLLKDGTNATKDFPKNAGVLDKDGTQVSPVVYVIGGSSHGASKLAKGYLSIREGQIVVGNVANNLVTGFELRTNIEKNAGWKWVFMNWTVEVIREGRKSTLSIEWKQANGNDTVNVTCFTDNELFEVCSDSYLSNGKEYFRVLVRPFTPIAKTNVYITARVVSQSSYAAGVYNGINPKDYDSVFSAMTESYPVGSIWKPSILEVGGIRYVEFAGSVTGGVVTITVGNLLISSATYTGGSLRIGLAYSSGRRYAQGISGVCWARANSANQVLFPLSVQSMATAMFKFRAEDWTTIDASVTPVTFGGIITC